MLKIRTIFFTLILIFLLALILNPNLYSQAQITRQTDSGFILKIIVPQFKYRETKKGKYIQRDYYEFTDESSPSKPKFIYYSFTS